MRRGKEKAKLFRAGDTGRERGWGEEEIIGGFNVKSMVEDWLELVRMRKDLVRCHILH